MKRNQKNSGSAAIVGVGAAACAACCAGPIIGLVSALGIGTAVSGAIFGVAGLLVAAVVSVVLVRRRRRRRGQPQPQQVPAPRRLAAVADANNSFR